MTKRRRRIVRRLSIGVFLALAGTGGAVGLGACTSTVRAPEQVPAGREETVWMVQDRMHLGLWMRREPGGFVEYGYGEWDWYALGHKGWPRVFPVILWPTDGTLARREVTVTDFEAVRAQFPSSQFEQLVVDRELMVALRDDLDETFQSEAAAVVGGGGWRMAFVPSDDSYWMFWNCNDAVTEWLRRLGCEVSSWPLRTDLEVKR